MSKRVPLTLVLFAVLCGCGEDPPEGPAPFVCTPAECPQGACKLVVDFAEDCAGQVVNGEVLLNGALEPTVANQGAQFVSKGDIPVGQPGEYWIRAERWQWGPIQFTCDDPAEDGIFKLSCTALPEEGE